MSTKAIQNIKTMAPSAEKTIAEAPAGELVLFTGKASLEDDFKEVVTKKQKMLQKRKEKAEKKMEKTQKKVEKNVEKEIILGQSTFMKNRSLCMSFYKGFRECRFATCDRAHSLDELVSTGKCDYDEECNLVNLVDGVLVNKHKNKVCHRLHSKETEENLLVRRGLDKYKGVIIVRKPFVPNPKVFVPFKTAIAPLEPKKISKTPLPVSVPAEKKIKQVAWKKPEVVEEVVDTKIPEIPSTPVDVPKDMVIDVLKLLIESGKNVKISFV